MNSITLKLPFPPSVNTYYRNVNGRTLMSARGRQYKSAVWLAVQQQGHLHKRMAGRIAVDVLAYAPDKRMRDIDNLAKGLLDAIAGAGVFMNDEQIDDLRVRRGPCMGKPGWVVVTITEIAHSATFRPDCVDGQ